MSTAVPAHPAAAAAARVFQSLPALRARPAERAGLPGAAGLRRAIEPRWEISSHQRRALRRSTSEERRQREQHAWLRGALGAFGVERAYLVALGPDGSPWWHVEPEEPVDWLAALARSCDHGAPSGHGRSPIRSRWGDGVEDLTVLSFDGARALLLETAEDELCSSSLSTEVLVHRAASRERVRALASGVPGLCVLRPVSGGGGPSILAEAVRPSDRCVARWSSGLLCEDRERLLLDGLTALSAEVPESRRARYDISAGAFGPLAWTAVEAQADPRWIVSLWDKGGLDRLFVSATYGDYVFGCLASGDGCEGLLVPIEEVRSA